MNEITSEIRNLQHQTAL